ncbi:hypothetical protein PR202_gb19858 [Eleusine coracana subsp. coracana]|uniref:Bidirectional sugar transporter SWEET n=1 Tax=Eleusine coracana subsp. coracana TaxID=191504 RepID=A0AAV5F9A5_ELECO|nr:hypothetical protein PR202_gb19858 [Eleusine coracana subsp. coracana]
MRPTFYRVYKKKSTESFQSVPYVVALLSAMLWLYYALLTRDVLLLSINAIACVVQSIYLTIYIVYAPKEAMAFTLKLLCTLNVALYGGMVAFLQFYVKGHHRVSIAGGIGAAFAFAVFVAPLAIIMPNILGLLFGLAQMALYFVYRNPKKNGAVSEIQVVEEQAADEIKDQQQQLQTHHVAANPDDANGEVAISDVVDANKNDDIVVDILPPSSLPPLEKEPPLPAAPPPAIPIMVQTAVEVV